MKAILTASVLFLSCAVFAKANARATESQDREFRDPFAQESGPAKPEVSDPLEPVNRAFFHFNDKLYCWVLRPVSKGYRTVTPKPVRECVDQLFTNLKYPVRVVNNLLEARFKGAGIETARFAINSTVGVAGLFDPAKRWNIKPQPADFNQTLAIYHVPNGIYLNWPVLGPSSVRGTFGMAGDAALNPTWYFDIPLAVTAGAAGLKTVNGTSLHIEEYDQLMSATLDPYVAMRSAYFEKK
ncbi:MAG: VacJ family lipoprotein [Verrucomicrobiota bacterium]